MSTTWVYRGVDGGILAEVRREDIPPLGYRVRIGGSGGPVGHFLVKEADAQKRELVLEVDLG